MAPIMKAMDEKGMKPARVLPIARALGRSFRAMLRTGAKISGAIKPPRLRSRKTAIKISAMLKSFFASIPIRNPITKGRMIEPRKPAERLGIPITRISASIRSLDLLDLDKPDSFEEFPFGIRTSRSS